VANANARIFFFKRNHENDPIIKASQAPLENDRKSAINVITRIPIRRFLATIRSVNFKNANCIGRMKTSSEE
jgi:hypothetical protein